MLTLYDAPRCPYCARVRIVLAEKDVPYETVAIDLDDRPAWLYEKNPPHGRVPVLEEDGWVLPESAVIDEYLEERFPEPPLLPADPAARAAARFIVFRFDDFRKPYYALRRGEPGAERGFALRSQALDALLERDAVPDWSGVRARGCRVSAVADPRRATCSASRLEPYPALARWLRASRERPSVAAELDDRRRARA